MKIYPWLHFPVALTLSSLTNSVAIAELTERPNFFEKHRDHFEAEMQSWEEEAPINSANKVDTNTLPWSRVAIKRAGFIAKMPPGAITHEVETIAAPQGELNFDIIATHPLSSRYVVAYSETLPPERFGDPQVVLQRAQDYIINNNVGLIENGDRLFTFDNYPGKEFKLQNQEETIVFRLLLIKQRLYVLAVNQHNDAISQKSIDVFFDSFQLIK